MFDIYSEGTNVVIEVIVDNASANPLFKYDAGGDLEAEIMALYLTDQKDFYLMELGKKDKKNG